jgi:hypothetical protein
VWPPSRRRHTQDGQAQESGAETRRDWSREAAKARRRKGEHKALDILYTVLSLLDGFRPG